ncbi:MAG: hypothetical protein NZ908_00860 [Candidatus Micrarchaeota archaeon]|nr:hypothetical protein [Candidatus Micrarchaeota archaeon]MCX8154695.1 hypothetical protein [Candidatus Micrarchaeota archaeon]
MDGYLDDITGVKRSSRRRKISKAILREELKRLRELRKRERLAINRAKEKFRN